MGRPSKKSNYDPQKVMKELMTAVCSIYEETGELKRTAEEIGLSPIKIRKVLVTAGIYENAVAEKVNRLYREGKSPAEIQEITGLGKSSVNGYLPYMKTPYKAKEVSLNAERIRTYRNRQNCVEQLKAEMTENALWEAVVLFQGYPFHTAAKYLLFSYELKICRNGTYNKELIISPRKESKTLTWSSIRLAFEKAKEKQGEIVPRPKALGDIRGISYVYAMFLRWGIVDGVRK